MASFLLIVSIDAWGNWPKVRGIDFFANEPTLIINTNGRHFEGHKFSAQLSVHNIMIIPITYARQPHRAHVSRWTLVSKRTTIFKNARKHTKRRKWDMWILLHAFGRASTLTLVIDLYTSRVHLGKLLNIKLRVRIPFRLKLPTRIYCVYVIHLQRPRYLEVLFSISFSQTNQLAQHLMSIKDYQNQESPSRWRERKRKTCALTWVTWISVLHRYIMCSDVQALLTFRMPNDTWITDKNKNWTVTLTQCSAFFWYNTTKSDEI